METIILLEQRTLKPLFKSLMVEPLPLSRIQAKEYTPFAQAKVERWRHMNPPHPPPGGNAKQSAIFHLTSSSSEQELCPRLTTWCHLYYFYWNFWISAPVPTRLIHLCVPNPLGKSSPQEKWIIQHQSSTCWFWKEFTAGLWFWTQVKH